MEYKFTKHFGVIRSNDGSIDIKYKCATKEQDKMIRDALITVGKLVSCGGELQRVN